MLGEIKKQIHGNIKLCDNFFDEIWYFRSDCFGKTKVFLAGFIFSYEGIYNKICKGRGKIGVREVMRKLEGY